MKFKATFTDRGLRTLEKGTLHSLSKLYAKIRWQHHWGDEDAWSAGICPALERHGKACHVLLSREDVHLIQTTMEADGMFICARWDIVRLPHTGASSPACCTLSYTLPAVYPKGHGSICRQRRFAEQIEVGQFCHVGRPI